MSAIERKFSQEEEDSIEVANNENKSSDQGEGIREEVILQ